MLFVFLRRTLHVCAIKVVINVAGHIGNNICITVETILLYGLLYHVRRSITLQWKQYLYNYIQNIMDVKYV